MCFPRIAAAKAALTRSCSQGRTIAHRSGRIANAPFFDGKDHLGLAVDSPSTVIY